MLILVVVGIVVLVERHAPILTTKNGIILAHGSVSVPKSLGARP